MGQCFKICAYAFAPRIISSKKYGPSLPPLLGPIRGLGQRVRVEIKRGTEGG